MRHDGIDKLFRDALRGDPREVAAKAAFALVVTVVSALLTSDDD